MKKSAATGILAAMALCLPVCLAAASPRSTSLSPSKPEFDEQGRLAVVLAAGEGRARLQILDSSMGTAQDRLFILGRGASLPVLKKEAGGRLWAVWTKTDGSGPKLVMGRLSDGLDSPIVLDFPVQPHLPWDFSFDASGHGWLAWVEEGRSGQAVRLNDLASGRAWTIASGAKEASSPRLLFDAGKGLWVFWTAVRSSQEQVFAKRFDGSTWSPEMTLSVGFNAPNITPRAAADPYGRVWVVWASYDGQDYEILARYWDSRAWAPTMAVTDNAGAQDVFPSVDLAFGIIPVVSWVRYTDQGSRAIARCGTAGGWMVEAELATLGEERPFVPLALKEDMVGLAWTDRGALRQEWRYLPGLDNPHGGKTLPPESLRPSRPGTFPPYAGPIYNPDLDENKYIAFGDSITSGVCDEDRIDDPGDYIPDKAYPPRLEALLTQNFGPHQVVNAGVPGESTIQGLARIDALLVKHLARYILILEGTNDIIWNDYSLETTSFNLQEIIRKSLEYGMLPALATNIQRYGWNPNRPRLYALNTRIRALAQECFIPLADLFQDFNNYPAEDGGETSLYCWGEDRTHPNEKGYQFMAEKWFERVKQFPFPPAQASVRRASDDILFFSTPGNLLEWQDNPKIEDPTQIQEFRVYRKMDSEPASAFRLWTAVAGQGSYFDSAIQTGGGYTYLISTVIREGIEGPVTPPLSR